MIHRRGDNVIGVDLFPFLSVILCIVGVLSILLASQSIMLPLLKKRANDINAYANTTIHRVVIAEETWEIPELRFKIHSPQQSNRDEPLESSQDENWENALKELLDNLGDEERTVESKGNRHIVEIAFDESSVIALRRTLTMVDAHRNRTMTATGEIPYNLYYRVLKSTE